MIDLWPEADDAFAELFDGAEAQSAEDAGVQADEAYQTRPIDWMVDRLGLPRETLVWSESPEYASHRWDGTPDPLVVMAQALADWQDTGAESATGTGKSFFVAALILWFLASFKGARVFTFAPKEDQLRLYIWTEIGKMWGRFKQVFPTAVLTDLRIRMVGGSDDEDSWGAVGYAVGIKAGEDVATKAAGMHAEHMLLVYEETPGIPKAVLEAGANTAVDPHNLRIAIGNPDNQADALHQFCTSPGVVAVRMSAYDHPNVVLGRQLIPGAVSLQSIERRKLRYGTDHRLYKSRVQGISPTESTDSLIKRVWCEDAVRRYGDPILRTGLAALGVDVANSEDGDKGAISRWQGSVCLEVLSFPCPNANLLGERIATEYAEVSDRHIGVDSVGVGAGTVNELKRLGRRVQALNAGTRPMSTVDEDVRWPEGHETGPVVVEEERFPNLRAQMWWQARRDLELGRIGLPNDAELFDDLTTPLWWTKDGKIFVEPKEDIRDRLGRSPDKGDAFVMGNWVRHRKRTTAPPEPVPNRNRDTGLERVLARMNQLQKKRKA